MGGQPGSSGTGDHAHFSEVLPALQAGQLRAGKGHQPAVRDASGSEKPCKYICSSCDGEDCAVSIRPGYEYRKEKVGINQAQSLRGPAVLSKLQGVGNQVAGI